MISPTLILILLVTPLLAITVWYAVLLLSVAIGVNLLRFRDPEPKDTVVSSAVEFPECAVLVPSFNEAEGLVAAVESLREQDYPGPLRIIVLLENEVDSSIPFLREEFELGKLEPGTTRISLSTERELEVVLTGKRSKRDKINAVLPKVKSPFIGFLDADHRARRDWIARSITQLSSGNAAAVQGRRSPLSLNRIPQIWDSAQNHVGNESLCEILHGLKKTVFFTGTTAVFRGEIVRSYQLADCITEDTFLSYELLLDGHRIEHLKESGSREEVAPTISSYLKRRRRWSNGHTQTFWHSLREILFGNNPVQLKFQLFFHGAFFLIPFLVLSMVFCVSLHTFFQLTSSLQCFAILGTTLLSVLVLYLIGIRSQYGVVRDFFLTWIWIGSLLTLFIPTILFVAESNLYFALLSFPYQSGFGAFHFFCLLSPLAALFIASFHLRILHVGQLFLFLCSYPFLLFLDILACTYGLFDFFFGKTTWHQVDRTFEDAPLEKEYRRSTVRTIKHCAVLFLSFGLCFLLLNELGASRQCGQVVPLFYKPFYGASNGELKWDILLTRKARTGGELTIHLDSTFEGALPRDTELSHALLNGENESQLLTAGQRSAQAILRTKTGWQPLVVSSRLKGRGLLCEREHRVTSTTLEIDERELLVNGEPFLLKGIIPSFSNAYTNLSTKRGFQQIKALGANVLRFYHRVPDATVQDAREEHLVIIDQPTKSTWSKRDVSVLRDQGLLKSDFLSLVGKASEDSTRLFPLFGNELELDDQDKRIKPLYELLKEISEEERAPFSYATYSTYLNYPAPILSINMLDTGRVYWESALELLTRYHKPIFAGELGGFVAFSERTLPELRIYRLIEQWNSLIQRDFLGAVIYQSHDNWAQPVPVGYNDPFTNDHPDDERGLWTRDNEPKQISAVVQELFNDLEMSTEGAGSEQVTLLTNRRKYALKNLEATDADENKIWEHEVLAPGESVEFSVDEPLPNTGMVNFSFETHGGLLGRATLFLPQFAELREPAVLNSDFIRASDNESSFQGKLIHSSIIRFVLPKSWVGVELEGEQIRNSGGVLSAQIGAPSEAVRDISIRSANGDWQAFDPLSIGRGAYEMRFRLPRGYSDDAFLVLDGLSSRQIKLRYGRGRVLKEGGERYRELIIPLKSFGAVNGSEYFYLQLQRSHNVYIHEKYHPFGEHTVIYPGIPWVFSPTQIEMKRIKSLE